MIPDVIFFLFDAMRKADGEFRHQRSSFVCGLDVHKGSVYATAMSFGGDVVDKRLTSCPAMSDPEVRSSGGSFTLRMLQGSRRTALVLLWQT